MIKQPRQKNDKHLDFIRGLPCAVPGCENNVCTEASHVRRARPELGKRDVGMGEKPDDKWTVPLCGEHHRQQHECAEGWFWKNIAERDPVVLALALWAATGNHELGEQIVRAAR